jgi:hypothetical protein
MSLPVEALPHAHRFILPVWSPPLPGPFSLSAPLIVAPRCTNKRCACGEIATGLSLEERTTMSVIHG